MGEKRSSIIFSYMIKTNVIILLDLGKARYQIWKQESRLPEEEPA